MLVSFSNNKSTRGVPVVRIPKSKNYSVVKKLGIRIITGSQEEQKAEPSTSYFCLVFCSFRREHLLASSAGCSAAYKVQHNRTVMDRYPNQVYRV